MLAALDRIALPLFLILFLALALVLPSVRVRRRTGQRAVVFDRRADPFQRLVGAAFALCIAGFTLFSALYALLGPERIGVWPVPASVRIAGGLLMLAGLGLVLVAQAHMGTSWRIGIDDRPTALVTRGVFGVVRNPIFTSMLILLTGAVLVAPAVPSVAGWLATAFLIAAQVRLEERHLIALHGDSYRGYAARVGRFFPGLGRLQTVDASRSR